MAHLIPLQRINPIPSQLADVMPRPTCAGSMDNPMALYQTVAVLNGSRSNRNLSRSRHPQINRQTERVNQLVEQYLRDHTTTRRHWYGNEQVLNLMVQSSAGRRDALLDIAPA